MLDPLPHLAWHLILYQVGLLFLLCGESLHVRIFSVLIKGNPQSTPNFGRSSIMHTRKGFLASFFKRSTYLDCLMALIVTRVFWFMNHLFNCCCYCWVKEEPAPKSQRVFAETRFSHWCKNQILPSRDLWLNMSIKCVEYHGEMLGEGKETVWWVVLAGMQAASLLLWRWIEVLQDGFFLGGEHRPAN